MASNTPSSNSNNQNQGQGQQPNQQAWMEFFQSLSNQAQHNRPSGGVDRTTNNNTNNQWMSGPGAWGGMWGPHARSGPWEQGHHGQWPGPPPPFPPFGNNGPLNNDEQGNDGQDGSDAGGLRNNHEDSPDTMPIDDTEHPPPPPPIGSQHPPSQYPPPPPPPDAPFPPFPHDFRPGGPGSHRRGGRCGGGHHGGHHGNRGGRGGRGGGSHGMHGMFPFPPPPPPPHGGPAMPGWMNMRAMMPWMNMLNGPLRGFADQIRQYAAGQEQQDDDTFKPPVDIFNRPSEWQVHVALPGAKKEDIGLNWDADKSSLRIAGVVHRPGDEEFIQSLVSGERRVGMFERLVAIPPDGTDESEEPDSDRISAKLENGVLVVTVPKTEREWTEVRSIDIE